MDNNLQVLLELTLRDESSALRFILISTDLAACVPKLYTFSVELETFVRCDVLPAER